jgi:hypothetical protein
MKIWRAQLAFAIYGAGSEQPTGFDYQFRMIHALSEEEAFEKSRTFGKKEEEETPEPLRWEFLGVMELHGSEDYSDGAIIHQCSPEHGHVIAHLEWLQNKMLQKA